MSSATTTTTLFSGPSPTEVVSAYLDAFGRGDVDAAVTLLAEDVVWHIDGSTDVFTIGLRRGPASVREWLTDFSDHFVPRAFALDRLIADGDAVVAIGRFRHTIRATGKTVGSTIGILFSVRAGRIQRYQILEDSLILARAFDPADDVERRQWIKLNGLRYGLSDQGRGTAGPKALFLHGLFLNRGFFTLQVDALTARGWHCLSLDTPGHGESEWRKGWSLEDFTADLALFVEEHVAAPVLLVGHSLGAMTGIRLAASRPDLVRGLVAINATARAEAEERLPQWRELQRQLAEGDYKARRQALAAVQARLLPPEFLTDHKETAARELDVMAAHDPAALTAAIDAAVLRRGDIRDRLPQVAVPLLAIGGALDSATPPDQSQEIAERANHGRAMTLPGVGHHAPFEAPDALTAALLDFAETLPVA